MEKLAHYQEEVMSALMHELAQPLTAINAYMHGLIHRLSNGAQEQEPLLNAMNKIMQNIECAEQIMRCLENCIHQANIK